MLRVYLRLPLKCQPTNSCYCRCHSSASSLQQGKQESCPRGSRGCPIQVLPKYSAVLIMVLMKTPKYHSRHTTPHTGLRKVEPEGLAHSLVPPITLLEQPSVGSDSLQLSGCQPVPRALHSLSANVSGSGSIAVAPSRQAIKQRWLCCPFCQ